MYANDSLHSCTIDPKEFAIFDKISSVWWDPNGNIRALHHISNLMGPFILEEVNKVGLQKKQHRNSASPLQGLYVLEVGCGGGLLSEKIASYGCNLTAIDINPQLIKVAKHHSSQNPNLSNINYLLEAVEEHVKENENKYDIVVTNFVLEHVNEQELFLESCIKCLRPGGSFIASSIGQTWKGWFYGIILPELILKKIPHGMHEWNKFITIEETEKIVKKYDCRTVATRGMCYSMLSEPWIWIDSTSIFYVLHSVKKC